MGVVCRHADLLPKWGGFAPDRFRVGRLGRSVGASTGSDLAPYGPSWFHLAVGFGN